jgi:hypothetical protein
MINILEKEKFLFALIILLFITIRICGLSFSYYQDETDWARIVNPINNMSGNIPHPPLGEKIYNVGGQVFGYDHLRLVPFIFSVLDLILLYVLVKRRFGVKAALWSSLFFSISIYSVIASLMVDTDGQIMPFFLLLALISYYEWQDIRSKKILWGSLLIVSLIGGFFIKISFIIGIGAIILDFLYSKKDLLAIDKKILLKYLAWIGGFLVSLFLLLLGAHFIFPFFRLGESFRYWEHFIVFSGRNYLQISIQFLKALLYLSPIFIASLFFVPKNIYSKLRVFLIFISLGLLFYLVMFDFSDGSLDRYLQFLIVPLSVVVGVVSAKIFDPENGSVSRKLVLGGVVFSVLLFLLQFLPHSIFPLQPKSEWFSHFLSFKWNFLFPFFGGSGPLPFYVSALFIALSWLGVMGLIFMVFLNKNIKKSAWMIILIIGMLYNFIFVEEYLFGSINGNSKYLLNNALNFIEGNTKIQKVITYNDLGRYELEQMGKYRRRLYADPKFEIDYKSILNKYKEYYLVIDIPHIYIDSMYVKYLNSCDVVYNDFDRSITAKIYDCRGAINID